MTIIASPPEALTQSSKGIETIAALANLGGQFVRVAAHDKKPLDTDWTNRPFDYDAALQHLKSGGNVGLLCGDQSARLGLLDVDVNYIQFCEKFPNLAKAPVIIRGGADRGKILVRINGNIPPSKKWIDNPERKLEWLSNGRQGVCAGIHPEGQPYEMINTVLPEPILTPEQLIDICVTWTGSQNSKQPRREHAPVISGKGNGKYWLNRALEIASPGNRNETGFWLACQCRDAGISENETKDLPYSERVTGEGYTREEWEASIESAYSQSPRAPVQSNHILETGFSSIGENLLIHESQVIAEPPDNFVVNQSPQFPISDKQISWTVADLLDNDFPEPRWAIPGIIPAGLSILGGRPKVGKSWMMLQAAWSVATGGMFFGNRVDKGDVFYLALEDRPRRLKSRIQKLGIPRDAMIRFVTEWKSMATDGLNDLIIELESHDYRMVVIDTLTRVAPGVDQKDETVIGPIFDSLQRMAQKRNIAIVVIDHIRKPSFTNADPIDDIMNSTAKTAIADAILALYKNQGVAGVNLKGRGRDIEEVDLKLNWDPITGCWQSEGNAGELARTERQDEILDALETLGRSQIAEIAKAIGKTKGNIYGSLQDLCNSGYIHRIVEGRKVSYEKI